MKFYLSSYRIGDHGNKLAELAAGGRLAVIPNALDHIPVEDQKVSRQKTEAELDQLGISFEFLDLQKFFDSNSNISDELARFSGVWITGGNTFVLRQAMRLSGFDEAIKSLRDSSFLYAGYSAGVCVLAPDLRALQTVDDPSKLPYPEQREVIWDGLNFLDYMILPHYKSNHPESADIDKEVEYCKANSIAYRTLRDGEVLFGDNIAVIQRESRLRP